VRAAIEALCRREQQLLAFISRGVGGGASPSAVEEAKSVTEKVVETIASLIDLASTLAHGSSTAKPSPYQQ
jgi:hypothetical protein